MPQLDPTWFASQLFWLAITFIALYAILSKLVLPPLLEIIARRRETIEGDIARAESMKHEAELARQDYERALGEARSRAQQLMSEAEAAHKAKADAATKDMDSQIQRKLAEASRAIAAKKQELMQSVAPATAELTAMIVEKLTQRKPAASEVSAIVTSLSKGQ